MLLATFKTAFLPLACSCAKLLLFGEGVLYWQAMRLLTLFVGNVLALALASTYITGIVLTEGLKSLLIVSLIFTAVNFIVKPVLKLLMGPFILLTFGLFTIVINMGMLWLTDVLSPQLQIVGISALFIATLLIGVINIIIHIMFKK